MKTVNNTVILAIALLLIGSVVRAQSVDTLLKAYTGKVLWNSTTQTVTFNTTGTMNFTNRELLYNNVWTMPENVKRVVIGKNVTVTGEFYAEYSCLIEGLDKETSVVFGTSKQNYLDQSRGFHAFAAADSKARAVTLTIKNLTSLNPKVYHISGSYLGVVHLDNCKVIDNRGGRYNNSDGFMAAKGSTIKNCYFETGEDVIKIYADILVENTTIKMIEFTVPIQCGWGDYGSGITATFKNLKIIGTEGRSPDFAIIEARQGNYTKNIIIDGITVTNPNAALFRLQQADATINVEITNADISLKKYGTVLSKGTRTICGSTEKKTNYKCILVQAKQSDKSFDAIDSFSDVEAIEGDLNSIESSKIDNLVSVYANLALKILSVDSKLNDPAKLEIYTMNGQLVKSQTVESGITDINIDNFSTGVHVVKLKTAFGDIVKKITVY